MSNRIDKVNKHLQRTFGEIIHELAELPTDVLVTVARADTAHNLKSSTVWLYIYPENREEEVMQILKPQMYELQGELNRRLDFNPLPRISLRIDHGAQHSQKINETLADLE